MEKDEIISTIQKEVDKASEKYINKYVNGKIDRLHEKFDNRDRLQDEAHKVMTDEFFELRADIKVVHDSLGFFRTLDSVIRKSATTVMSLGAIATGFWAFMKFVVNNLK
jgi:vancomycin permeability regulator SanA